MSQPTTPPADGPTLAAAARSAGRRPVAHILKTLVQYLDAVGFRQKAFEVRRDDRDFQVGDWVMLRQWDDQVGAFGARWIICKITYVLRGAEAVRFGVQEGYCVLGIRLPANHQWPPNAAVIDGAAPFAPRPGSDEIPS